MSKIIYTMFNLYFVLYFICENMTQIDTTLKGYAYNKHANSIQDLHRKAPAKVQTRRALSVR